MASAFVKNLVIERRKRLVGNLMDYAEKQLYPKLTAQEQRAFRDKVMQAVGEYHDVVLDILKSSVEDGTVLHNEEAVRLLTDLHDRMVRRG